MSFVGAGDVIQIASLTQDFLQSYINAPREFVEVSNYARSLRLVLEELRNNVEGIDLSPNLTTTLQTVTTNSQTLLEEFNDLVKRRASLTSPKDRKLLDRIRWPSKQMDSLRIRLSTQTSLLLLFHQSISSFKQTERETKLESRIDDISRQMRERRPPETLPVKSKSLDELVSTFMPDWYSVEVVREETAYYANVTEVVEEAFVTCRWRNYEPVIIQLAGPNACAQLLEVLKRPSLAMDFDRAFPGDRGIRKDLINAASHHLLEYQDRGSVVVAANAVMMLMFLISHKRKLGFNTDLADMFGHEQLVSFFRSRLTCILARTLMHSLREVLWNLEHLMKKGRREDWPVAFVAMCFVLFGIECMTVNVHIFEPDLASRLDEKVEINGVHVLLDRFMAYTHGVNPLELDWSMPKNKELVQMDETVLSFSKSLQEVASQHWRFLQDRRKASYDQSNDSSYIGKFVSALMV